MRIPVKAWMGLALIWILVGGAVWFSRSVRPTPEKARELIAKTDLASMSTSARMERVDKLANLIARLKVDERRELRKTREIDAFFETMNDEEQGSFLDKTLPSGFREMIQTVNSWPPDRRKRFVERAINDFEKHAGTSPEGERLSEENKQKIIKHGLSAFFEDASADVKMDFAPLLEEMQRAAQHLQ